MQRLQNCIGPTIRIGREILCLPYAGFFYVVELAQGGPITMELPCLYFDPIPIKTRCQLNPAM